MADEFYEIKNIFKYNKLNIEPIKADDDFGNINTRSTAITEILVNYKEQQAARNKYKEEVKMWFVPIFSVVAVIFVVLTVIAVSLSFKYLREDNVVFLTSVIGSLITGFGSVISILLIITKYIFPNDEEKNFNDLISIIVQNDAQRLQHVYHDKKDILKENKPKKDE